MTNAPAMPDSPSLRYSSRLSRIQETNGGSNRLGSPPARAPSPPQGLSGAPTSPQARSGSPLSTQPLRYVSEKARQFESGLLHPDKTDLYRYLIVVLIYNFSGLGMHLVTPMLLLAKFDPRASFEQLCCSLFFRILCCQSYSLDCPTDSSMNHYKHKNQLPYLIYDKKRRL